MPHEHQHTSFNVSTKNAFIAGIVLNLAFVFAEFIAGYVSNSMSLMSDAGHNLSDVVTLAISLLAFRLAKVKNNDKLTYGYRKSTILTALFNSVLLFAVVLIIAYQAIMRFFHPVSIDGVSISIVAVVGIVINAISALLFFKEKNNDLNVKSAYLHLMADALVSLGVVVAGVIIYFTSWLWIDSVVSLGIAIIIIYSTWELLKDSFLMALDAVPENVNIQKVKETILKIENVKDLHHLHVWALSTTENALTAHVVLNNDVDFKIASQIKEKIKLNLLSLHVAHATIEFENETDNCNEIHK